RRHIVILGAGITGLSTALKLNSNPASAQYNITIIAAHLPGDESIDYTSPWAGADWSPQATSAPADASMREYDKSTYNTWAQIIETNHAEAANLGLGDAVKDFQVLDLEREEIAPEGAVMGVKYRTICLSVPQHLKYLMEKVREAGTQVIQAKVDVTQGLEGVVKDAKRLAMESNKAVKEGDFLALINCTGLAARHFVGVEEAAKLFPIRGQTILVKGEATIDRTYEDFPASPIEREKEELTYVIPRPGSGTTIFGGCKQAGNWDPEVDEELNGRMLERIKRWKLAEELRSTNKGGEFEIVSSQVGLRPGRKGGPRVDIEGEKKVRGVWVIHSYGHAGAGYQNSGGCSEKVAKMVNGLVEL
ncbi:nucleotide-binding domain-containing protein, partial [Stipitochalara longipes BDJ]